MERWRQHPWELTLQSAFTESVSAQNSMHAGQSSKTGKFPENSTIVLVHAAWVDGWCWGNVILPLERSGLCVVCAPIPMTSPSDDAAALSRALERTSGPVVLVGHAYSGAMIAAVQEERVKSVAYVAAPAPDEGETVAKGFLSRRGEPGATEDGSGCA